MRPKIRTCLTKVVMFLFVTFAFGMFRYTVNSNDPDASNAGTDATAELTQCRHRCHHWADSMRSTQCNVTVDSQHANPFLCWPRGERRQYKVLHGVFNDGHSIHSNHEKNTPYFANIQVPGWTCSVLRGYLTCTSAQIYLAYRQISSTVWIPSE